MIKDLLEEMGLNLYAVIFYAKDFNSFITIMVYSTTENNAKYKALKRLSRRSINMFGNWEIDVERV